MDADVCTHNLTKKSIIELYIYGMAILFHGVSLRVKLHIAPIENSKYGGFSMIVLHGGKQLRKIQTKTKRQKIGAYLLRAYRIQEKFICSKSISKSLPYFTWHILCFANF